MAAAAPTGLLTVLFLILSGGFGLPLGVPPEPADPMLARVAPEECLLYLSWAGMAKPAADSRNETERLLAEPEIQQVAAAVLRAVDAAVKREAGGDPHGRLLAEVGPKLVKTLLTRPVALFVSDVNIAPAGLQVDAGVLVNLGDDADQVRRALERLENELLGGRAETVEIGGMKLQRIVPGPGAPSIAWGFRGKYLIVGVGEKAVEGMLARVRQEPPKWLAGLLERSRIPRISQVARLDVARLLDRLLPLIPEPRVGSALDALGLRNVSQVASVSGLDDTGFVSRAWIDIDGPARGLLALMDAKPLAAGDLAPIPHDALVAAALRLNLRDVLDTVLKVAGQIEPNAAEEMQRGLGQVEEVLGFRVRDELLTALGDVWTLSAAPSDGGLITGWIATVQLRDRQRIADIHQRLLTLVREKLGGERRGPQIRQLAFAGRDIFYLVVRGGDFPLTPAWCLTDNELVVALFPQALKGYLSRDKEFRSLAQNPAVAGLVKADVGPLALVYMDTRTIFRTFYPFLQIGGQIALHHAERQGFALDPILIPSGSAIEKHLRPFVLVQRRTATGIEIISHQTAPSMLVSTAAAVPAPLAAALLLPAVQSARSAAQRTELTNNLKQIGLAIHNYHDTFRALPAAYSVDKEGKPLLSWRVHILPYVEQQALYKQFRLDEPWDSEHNRKLIGQMQPTYRSPNSKAAAGKTNYLGIRGKGGVFVAPKEGRPQEKFPRGTSFAEILDGTSNTIMVVEASDERAVTWTKPDDLEPDAQNPVRGLVGLWPGKFQVLFCDGSVRSLPQSIGRETLLNAFDRADGNVIRWP